MKDILNELDKAFENRVRLGIMSALVVNDYLDYNTLKQLLGVTDGNLASHLKSLEKDAYIHFKKEFIERKPNTKYFLKYSKQTERESNEMRHWNSDKKEYEKVYWKTTDKKSLDTLNSNLTLEFDKTEVIHYGCGPDANAIFNIKNKSSSEVWYKTEVVDIKTNEQTTYYIKEWNEQLHVGHGMCAGAFTFNNKGKYKVRFTPMNTDGKSLKTTEWKTFDSPFMNAKSPFGN